MCAVEIRLLGRPSVTVGGEIATPPRGAKAWGVLAYLAASERGRSRSEIAELLFGAAEDPLGALRWNLAALRRLLGLPDLRVTLRQQSPHHLLRVVRVHLAPEGFDIEGLHVISF